jgi:hypothetical protein
MLQMGHYDFIFHPMKFAIHSRPEIDRWTVQFRFPPTLDLIEKTRNLLGTFANMFLDTAVKALEALQ